MVRNSSTQALFGFCATFYYPDSSLGVVASIFVDPAKRNLSIGHSLHQRAIRGLIGKTPKPQRLQLGSGLPSVYLGIPMGDISEGARLKRWFAANGWEAASQQALFTLTVRNLSTWEPPEGLLQSIQRFSFSFDLIHGKENSESVIEHVKQSSPEIQTLYQLALEDPKACGIVRAKSPVDGSLVGTVIICRPESSLAAYMPVLKGRNTSGAKPELVGGIVAPVVPGSQQQAGVVLQGLTLLGLRQNKAHRAGSCVLNWVGGDERDLLLGMGFDVLDAFEELSVISDRVRF